MINFVDKVQNGDMTVDEAYSIIYNAISQKDYSGGTKEELMSQLVYFMEELAEVVMRQKGWKLDTEYGIELWERK